MSKPDNPKHAVMYLRVASARQEDQAAIARQREGCLRIAAQHGLTVIREYVDAGRSAHLEQITHHIRSCGANIVTITGVEAAERFVREREQDDLSERRS